MTFDENMMPHEETEAAAYEVPEEAGTISDEDISLRIRKGSLCPGDGRPMFRIWRVIYPFAADMLVQVLVGIAVAVFAGAVAGGLPVNEALTITIISDIVMIPIFWIMLRRDDAKRRAQGAEAFRIPKVIDLRITDIPAVVFFMVCACRIYEVIIAMTIVNDAAYEEVAGAIYSPGLMLQLTAVAVIGPVMEELLFRGIIYRRIRDYIGFVPAVVISAAAFGSAHGNLTQGAFAAGIGILLALIYEHYGTIVMPVAAHIANNLYAVLSVRVDHSAAILFLLLELIAVFPLGIYVFSKKRKENAI